MSDTATLASYMLSDELVGYVKYALSSLADAVNDIPSLSFVSFLRENILYVFVCFYVLWYIKARLSVRVIHRANENPPPTHHSSFYFPNICCCDSS